MSPTSKEIAAILADPDCRSAAHAILSAIAIEHGAEPDGSSNAVVDVHRAATALLYAAALLLETSPDLKDRRDYRRSGDGAGRLLAGLIEAFRAQTARDGAHPIGAFVVLAKPN